MRASMAYFAGAGTIVVAIAAGLGGGLTIANIVSPHKETREISKLEQRMAAKPIPPSVEADQPRVQSDTIQASNTDKPQTDQPKAPVPYVAATGAAVTANTPVAQAQPQTQAAASQASPSPVIEQAKVDNPSAKPAEPQTAKDASREQAASSPDDANAKARDSDLKRLAAEKRKADRRQQWADRKKALLSRDAELRDVEESVRRDTDGPRIVRRDIDGPRIVVRQDDDDSDRPRGFDRHGDRGDRPFGFPGFNLFGGDRD